MGKNIVLVSEFGYMILIHLWLLLHRWTSHQLDAFLHKTCVRSIKSSKSDVYSRHKLCYDVFGNWLFNYVLTKFIEMLLNKRDDHNWQDKINEYALRYRQAFFHHYCPWIVGKFYVKLLFELYDLLQDLITLMPREFWKYEEYCQCKSSSLIKAFHILL